MSTSKLLAMLVFNMILLLSKSNELYAYYP